MTSADGFKIKIPLPPQQKERDTESYVEGETKDSLSQNTIHQQREKNLYSSRVMGMRVQFAWAVFALVITWLFIILFFIISWGVEMLYPVVLFKIAFVIIPAFAAGIFLYSLLMTVTENLHCKIGIQEKCTRLRAQTLHYSVCGSIITAVFFAVVAIWHTPESNAIKIPIQGISDSVLITLITSTTISVLGILTAVMWWLFPRKQEDLKD